MTGAPCLALTYTSTICRGVVVISLPGRRSHTGPDAPGHVVIRVYLFPVTFQLSWLPCVHDDGVTWWGRSGIPCGDRQGDDRGDPPGPHFLHPPPPSPQPGRGLGQRPKVYRPSPPHLSPFSPSPRRLPCSPSPDVRLWQLFVPVSSFTSWRDLVGTKQSAAAITTASLAARGRAAAGGPAEEPQPPASERGPRTPVCFGQVLWTCRP